MSGSPSSPSPIPTITGPTAVGKTALSLPVAEALNAEIVSVDSRQIYEELTIGTAKPSASEQARVPHHFIGERSLSNPITAGDYAEAAHKRLRAIQDRGRIPLVVGGATLYLHALQYGLADIPEVADEVRERLEKRLEEEGPDALYRELKEVDPKQAEKADPTKTQRVIRALEVYHGTGKPLTHYHEQQSEPPFVFETVVLNRNREELHARIGERVDRMLENGLLNEVQDLVQRKGVELDESPLSTIGYREPIRYLRGKIDYEEMVRLIKRNTRRYAKKQITWFRRYDEYTWRDAAETSVEDLVTHFRSSA